MTREDKRERERGHFKAEFSYQAQVMGRKEAALIGLGKMGE